MDKKPAIRQFLHTIASDPLAHFLILGSVLWFGWSAFAPQSRETIRIEASAIRVLEKNQEELLGRPPTEREVEQIRESYIDDEILLHEALRRGIHWSDFRVRQRLTRIMRGALTESIPDPSIAQLEAYFRENAERFARPASTTFEQVFHPWEDNMASEELRRIVIRLRSGADFRQFGEDHLAARRISPRTTRADLVRGYGAAFADQMETLAAGEWSGPFDSVIGAHIVRVVARHPAEAADFATIESYLRNEWFITRTRELQQSRVDEIRAHYRLDFVEE